VMAKRVEKIRTGNAKRERIFIKRISFIVTRAARIKILWVGTMKSPARGGALELEHKTES
jgi:hypothetical protein